MLCLIRERSSEPLKLVEQTPDRLVIETSPEGWDTAKHVIVYTAALLGATLPVMPYVKATREFALALVVCGLVLSLSSFYVARGELKLKARGLLGNKLAASLIITFLFGISIFVGAIIYLVRSEFDG